MNKFTNDKNTEMLWEVILDELNVNNTNKQLIENIKQVFNSNMTIFISKANPNEPLLTLNKNFLNQVVLAVNQIFPYINNIKRIKISDEDVKETYKIEDIHETRKIELEKEFELKKLEMDSLMFPKKPVELDFSYKNMDGKIKSMDSLVSDKLLERNMEIEHFQMNMNVDVEEWLKPKETSVKKENIDINKQKKVSWYDNSSNINMNIFEKLKTKEETNVDEINMVSNQNQYVEQQSMELPEVKKDDIIKQQMPMVPVPVSNSPIIPKSEIVKQLNDMNEKLDKLYDMLSKIIKGEHQMV